MSETSYKNNNTNLILIKTFTLKLIFGNFIIYIYKYDL